MDGKFVNFEYLVVVSFDWVPYLGEQNEPQELIEFSWIVVYNGADSALRGAESGILHHCQLWVVPEHAQVNLEDYPELEKAISPSAALLKFEKFLKKAFVAQSKTFCLILENEARFSALRWLVQQHTFAPLQSYWKRAFNLRTELNRAYGVTEPLEFKVWLSRLRITNGSFITALDEAFTMVQVIHHLMCEGYRFTNAEWVKERWERQSARTSPTTAWIGGLPWHIAHDDILNFFDGCNLASEGIVRCISKKGSFTGFALVEFVSPIDLTEALLRNGQYLCGAEIRVGPAARGEYERIARKQFQIQTLLWGPSSITSSQSIPSISPHSALTAQPQSQARWTGVLKPVYEPTAANFAAISSLLSGSSAQISLPNDPLAPHSMLQTPFPGLSNSNSQQAPPIATANTMQVDPSQITSRTNSGSLRLHSDVCNEMKTKYPHGTVVHLKGLPYTVSEGQIAEFFSTFPPEPKSLVFTTTEDGRSSGEALVCFSSHDLASQAVRTLSGQYIGSRYVDLLIVP